MNYSTAVFLINKAVRAVKVSYDRDANNLDKFSGSLTMFKTFDTGVKVGDFVVVPTDTRWHMTVCRVEEVDVEVDLESGATVGWLVGVVDRAAYTEVLAQESAAITAIKSAEKRRRQEELAASLLKDNPELQGLAGVGGGVALPSPAAEVQA
jgi:hypothetical protein